MKDEWPDGRTSADGEWFRNWTLAERVKQASTLLSELPIKLWKPIYWEIRRNGYQMKLVCGEPCPGSDPDRPRRQEWSLEIWPPWVKCSSWRDQSSPFYRAYGDQRLIRMNGYGVSAIEALNLLHQYITERKAKPELKVLLTMLEQSITPVPVEEKPSYPQHERLKEIADQSQVIHEFLEYVREKGYTLKNSDGWALGGLKGDDLLAQFFGIDLAKLEQEKRTMIAALR